jgi:hypothetical protein
MLALSLEGVAQPTSFNPSPSPRSPLPRLFSMPSATSVLRKTPAKSATNPFASIDGELSAANHLSSCPLSFNFHLSTVNCSPLTPFPATLAGHPQLTENPATLSPLPATLTSRVKPKSRVCHSCKKTPGVGDAPCKRKSPLCCRTPQLSTLDCLLLPCASQTRSPHA